MRRRPFLASASGTAVVGLAGCATFDGDEPDDDAPVPEVEEDADDVESDGPLRVATYSSMVAGEESFGQWLTEAFETAYPDAELEWTVPDASIDHYRRRAEFGVGIDADVYLGLSATDLALVDDVEIDRERGDDSASDTESNGEDELPADGSLFTPLDHDRLERREDLQGNLQDAFGDGHADATPVGYGYVSPVVDERAFESDSLAFDTLADLPELVGEESLLVQHPRYSTPGRAFLCWTIDAFGDDSLEFWQTLEESGLDVRQQWAESYEAYLAAESPAIVSYSTDRVGAVDDGRPLEGHRVLTPADSGYRTVEGAAIVAGTDQPDLAYAFLNFLHTDEVQTELAVRNRQFPAIDDQLLEHPALVREYAVEPENPVTIPYDELTANLPDWLTTWEEEIAD